MISTMLSGTLSKSPEARTTRTGSSFAVAIIRVQPSEGDIYASVTAFGDLANTLLSMEKSDPITVVGSARITTYQSRDGTTKAGLAVTASRIVALVDQQSKPRERKLKERQPELATEYNDDVPF